VPPRFFSDEASVAYDPKGIETDGRDSHGVLLPVFFQSFDTWRASELAATRQALLTLERDLTGPPFLHDHAPVLSPASGVVGNRHRHADRQHKRANCQMTISGPEWMNVAA
jgi:hypothetical protein